MNKFYLILILGVLFGCNQKEAALKTKIDLKKTIANHVIIDSLNPLSTDTVFFNSKDELKYKDYALINLNNKKINKNKIITANFQVSFFENKKLVYNDQFEVKGYDEGSVFSCTYILDSLYSPLKVISLGYPACGYSAYNILFYVNKDKSSKLHTWISTSDSGWFSDLEFHKISDNKFYAFSKSFWPIDELTQEETESNDDYGMLEHSDSLVFIFKNSKWIKELKTLKSKTYFSKRISYNSYHNFNTD